MYIESFSFLSFMSIDHIHRSLMKYALKEAHSMSSKRMEKRNVWIHRFQLPFPSTHTPTWTWQTWPGYRKILCRCCSDTKSICENDFLFESFSIDLFENEKFSLDMSKHLHVIACFRPSFVCFETLITEANISNSRFGNFIR